MSRKRAANDLALVLVDGLGARTRRQVVAERAETGTVVAINPHVRIELHRSKITIDEDDAEWLSNVDAEMLKTGDEVCVISAGDDFIVIGVTDDDGTETVIPTGSMLLWKASEGNPDGWITCNGGSFSSVAYPDLNALWGGNDLPDDPDLPGLKLIVRAR